MAQIGTGEYTYELIPDFFKLPNGETFGLVSRVAADAQDRVYVFQRKDPPVVVFDRDGKYLGAWGSGEVTDPHGLKSSTMSSTPPIARLGREVVYLGRQTPVGAWHARRAFRHRPYRAGWRSARPGRSTTRPR